MLNFFALVADLFIMGDGDEDEFTSFQRLKGVHTYKVWHVLVAVCLLPSWSILGAGYVVVITFRFLLNIPVFKKEGPES